MAAIRNLVGYLLAQAIANTIATFAIIVVPFALMGQWPPRGLLIASSMGGALSPFAWRAYRAVFGYPGADKINGVERKSNDTFDIEKRVGTKASTGRP